MRSWLRENQLSIQSPFHKKIFFACPQPCPLKARSTGHSSSSGLIKKEFDPITFRFRYSAA